MPLIGDCSSLLLRKEDHHKNGNVVEYEQRHNPFHNFGAELVVEELNDHTNIFSFEHILIVLPYKLLQEEKSNFIIDDPIGTDGLNLNSVS